jgi:hypothetical protein
MKILWFARQKKGKFFVCSINPSPCPTFIFIQLCPTMFPHKYLMLSIIFFYSFVILTDVNGSMLTAGWNQMLL